MGVWISKILEWLGADFKMAAASDFAVYDPRRGAEYIIAEWTNIRGIERAEPVLAERIGIQENASVTNHEQLTWRHRTPTRGASGSATSARV